MRYIMTLNVLIVCYAIHLFVNYDVIESVVQRVVLEIAMFG